MTSTPTGAIVSVNGKRQGATPLEITLAKSEKNQVIRIESPGYNPLEIRPRPKRAGSVPLGNVLLGVAGAVPVTLFWMLSNDEDYGAGVGLGGVAVLSAAGFAAVISLFDGSFKKGYVFTPKELAVTLTKADGPARIDTLSVDADVFRDLKWIRVKRH